MAAVVEAVAQLEKFPMTSELLQSTRIGKFLNSIRKQTNGSLQNRIRHIIRSWQLLTKTEYTSSSVVPIEVAQSTPATPVQYTSGNGNSNGSKEKGLTRAATLSQLDHLSTGSLPVSPCLSQASIKSSPIQPLSSYSNSSITPQPLQTLSKKRSFLDLDDTKHLSAKRSKAIEPSPLSSDHVHKPVIPVEPSTPDHTLPAPIVSNGRSGCSMSTPKFAPVRPHRSSTTDRPYPSVDASDNRSLASDSSNHTGTTRSRTGIVNSARSIKIKSTADLLAEFSTAVSRDTVSRILCNEIKKEPDLPQSALPESVRPRQYRAKTAKDTEISTFDSFVEEDSYGNSRDSVTAAKSEMMEKFLDSAVRFTPEDDLPSRLKETPKPATGHKWLKHKEKASRFTKCAISPVPEEEPINNHATDSKKLKRKKKHNKNSKHSSLPITNFMNNWPVMPPIPEDIDWSSLDYELPETKDVDPSTSDRLLDEDWAGVNGTLNADGTIVPLTKMYSVPSGDKLIHLLPWCDLSGSQRQFFPENAEEVMDDIQNLPDPW